MFATSAGSNNPPRSRALRSNDNGSASPPKRIHGRAPSAAKPQGGSSERRFELRQLWQILTKADVVLVVAVTAWAGALVVGSGSQGQGRWLVVEVRGSEKGSHSMSEARIIRVEGPLGVTEIEISADGARVVRAPCRNEICVRAGWIRRTGEVTVCIPNRVLLRLEGPRSGPRLDGVSR